MVTPGKRKSRESPRQRGVTVGVLPDGSMPWRMLDGHGATLYYEHVMRTVYIETSVVSYYTGRASRDVVIAGRQQSTREFWQLLTRELLPFVSVLVLGENT